jgi:hypothetical protein
LHFGCEIPCWWVDGDVIEIVEVLFLITGIAVVASKQIQVLMMKDEGRIEACMSLVHEGAFTKGPVFCVNVIKMKTVVYLNLGHTDAAV